jgi:UDP-N-acetylglucosamine 1-carboxyvinyltransferase
MQKFIVEGPQTGKKGEIPVYGAKNSALKLIPASLLCDEPVTFHGIPAIGDIVLMMDILRSLGAKVKVDGHSVTVDPTGVENPNISFELAMKMRASFLFVSPLLTRFETVRFPHPGGDAIGRRPIDMTLEQLTVAGVDVSEGDEEYILKRGEYGLQASDYVFKWITHTGTENAIMTAVKAQGTTTLYNCAMEPEVVALCDFLRACGAKITGDGSPTIVIEGVEYLSGCEHTNIPDRLEVGTFVILGALTKSELTITDINPEHLRTFWKFMDMVGVRYELGDTWVKTLPDQPIFTATDVKTHEYPGFVTDLQAPFTLLLTQAKGFSMVHETIFDGRLFYTDSLNKMGANILLCDPYRAAVHGPTKLYGKKIESPDVRAGMTFLLAGLIAEGKTEILNIHHIDRGYERVEERLNAVGFEILRQEMNC